MISVIITAKNEARTIVKAVGTFGDQDYGHNDWEIIVVAPDEETLAAARAADNRVIILKDENRGKPAALNLALKKAGGERIIFSDGDVVVGTTAVKYLLSRTESLISGQPVVAEDKNNLFGFWQKVLFAAAHRLRTEKQKGGQYFPASGYLYLVSRELLADFEWPEESLAEDEYLSYYAWHRGVKIGYEPRATVAVKGPENFSDWRKQKIRTLGASYQIPREWQKGLAARTLGPEASGAGWMWKKFGNNNRQRFWLALLFLARLYVWFMAAIKVKILRQKRAQIWQRVESSK